mgnify:CR=1 FL=1
MEFSDKEFFEDQKERNTDPYGSCVIRYTEGWADLMEAQMKEGKKLEDIAAEASHTADTEGITGFMYSIAVAVLSECWTYGEELRKWHNLKTQIRNEGEIANETGATLNPALLSVEQAVPYCQRIRK